MSSALSGRIAMMPQILSQITNVRTLTRTSNQGLRMMVLKGMHGDP
jgi:hypothetical protein